MLHSAADRAQPGGSCETTARDIAAGLGDRLTDARQGVSARHAALSRALLDRELGRGDTVEAARTEYLAAQAALADLVLLGDALPPAVEAEQEAARQRNMASAERYRAEHRKRYEETLAEFGRVYPTLRHDDPRRMATVRELWDLAVKARAVPDLRTLFARHNVYRELRHL